MNIQRILFPTDFSGLSKAAEKSACDLADQFGAELHVLHVLHDLLLTMPSFGYHGVKRLLLGSVAERVLRHANCPVLVLRRPE